MTKQDELELLELTIERYRDDSYVGSWLKKCKSTIENCIKNDYPINVMEHVQLGEELDPNSW